MKNRRALAVMGLIASAVLLTVGLVGYFGFSALQDRKTLAYKASIAEATAASQAAAEALAKEATLPEALETELKRVKAHLDMQRETLESHLRILDILRAEESFMESLLREEATYAEAIIKRLDAVYQKSKLSSSTSAAELLVAKQEAEQARQRVVDLEAKLEGHKSKLEALKSSLATAKTASSDTSKAIKELTSNRSARATRLAQLEVTADALVKQESETAKEVKTLQAQEQKLESDIEELKKRLGKK